MDVLSLIESSVLDILLYIVDLSTVGKTHRKTLTENSNILRGYALQPQKFAQITLFLSIVYENVLRNEFVTKRAIFYENPRVFCNQNKVDYLIAKFCKHFRVCRNAFKTLATSKAIAFGDVGIRTTETLLSFKTSEKGVSLISSPIQEADIDCSAMFVLVIEKDATFQKILSSSLYRDFNPCLFLTAKGYPDLATRSFLSMLCDKYPALPVYALVDADPHGIGIYLNYKYGSQNEAMKLSATISPFLPRFQLLGILPSELSRLQIPSESLLDLTETDKSLIKTMKGRTYMTSEPQVLQELETLERTGKKAEIQCLDGLSSDFLCLEYLRRKLHQHSNSRRLSMVDDNFSHFFRI